MKKVNPLFTDTSRVKGEPVLTAIELDGVRAIYGEKVYAVLNQEGRETVRQPLWHMGHGKWRAEIYLQHQEEVRYQFFLSHEGNIVDCTKEKSSVVSYMISDTWRSIKEEAVAETEKTANEIAARETNKEAEKSVFEPVNQYLKDYLENLS